MAVEKETIIIKGAREHNLKDIDVEIPRDSFTVITGLIRFRKIISSF